MRDRAALLRGSALVAALSAASCSLILGLGDPALDATGGGGSGLASSSTSHSSSGSGGLDAGDAGDASDASDALDAGDASDLGDSGDAGSCVQTAPVCTAVSSDCLALHDNSQVNVFTLRIAQATVLKPDAFVTGFAATALDDWVTENLPACSLQGLGSMSWLLQFDRTNGVLTLGASLPAMDPTQGYSFINEAPDAGPFPIQPQATSMSIASNGVVSVPGAISQIALPIYTDTMASGEILIPIHQVTLTQTTLSPDNNCIGSFDPSVLSTSNGCQPDVEKGLFSFVNGGRLTGYINLYEADSLIIDIPSLSLDQSLCVLLSGDTLTYGDGQTPAHCKQQNGTILFAGDWCPETNGPATPACADGLVFDFMLAASGVALNP